MTDRRFHAELTLPNHDDALPLAHHFLERLAALAELDTDDASEIVAAADEACENVVVHAYEPGEEGSFTLVGDANRAGLTVGIRDRGLPFDPGATSVGHHVDHEGLSKIRAAVDSAEWINHGPEGKELRLLKRRPAVEIDTAELDDPVDDDEMVPLAPEQDYEVRRFAESDALGVSQVIYRNYGHTYLHVDCYYPERLVALNESGELASVVAVTADGEVVGHYALERPGLAPVAERGMAVVSPAHRGRDLMTRMRTFIEDEARALGLIGVWSVAVTNHAYSQRVNEAFGSDVCGVELAGAPASMTFKGIGHGELPERLSFVMYFTYVQPPRKALVHAPARHREVIDRIYEGLELPVEWHDEVVEPMGEGQLDVSYHRGLDAGTVKVRQVGADTTAEVRRATRDLIDVTGADVVYCHLPLADAATPALLGDLEAVGYCFSGIGPSFATDGDALVLQCVPPEVAVTYDAMEVASPFAAELVDYVAADRSRVLAV